MTVRQPSRHERRVNWQVVSLLIAGTVIAILLAANAHLVYVAVSSQPDCVPHTTSTQHDGSYRAARSSC